MITALIFCEGGVKYSLSFNIRDENSSFFYLYQQQLINQLTLRVYFSTRFEVDPEEDSVNI